VEEAHADTGIRWQQAVLRAAAECAANVVYQGSARMAGAPCAATRRAASHLAATRRIYSTMGLGGYGQQNPARARPNGIPISTCGILPRAC